MIYLGSYILLGLIVLVTYRLVENKHPAFGDITRKTDIDAAVEMTKVLLGNVPLPLRCGFALSRALDGIFNALRWPVLALDLFRRMTYKPASDSTNADELISDYEKRGTLLRYTSIPDIEARERVADPGGGAPAIAFGHLNSAWLRFKSQFRPGDRIIQYECLRRDELTADPWSHGGEGYLLVRKERVVAKVLTRSG